MPETSPSLDVATLLHRVRVVSGRDVDRSATGGLMLHLPCRITQPLRAELYSKAALLGSQHLTLYTYIGLTFDNILFAPVDGVSVCSWSAAGAFLRMHFAV